MIQIYGMPRSSAGRCFLLLEELGLPYEVMPLDMAKKEHKSEKFLKLNPNGKIPCLIDDGFVIWESLAINFYLADKYKPQLLGKTPQERGLVQQWSTWALAELQPPLVDMLIQLLFVPEERRNMKVVEEATQSILPLLQLLDQSLEGKSYLVGNNLTLAEFNVGSIVNIAAGLKISLDPYHNLTSWMSTLKDRPSFKKFTDLRK
jgi:glutathione S-transferase